MSNHLQSPPNTLSNSPKNFKPNQAKSVREKKGWTIFQNLSNGHFSSRGIRPKIFSRVKILKKKNLPFVTKLLTHQSPFWTNGHSKFQKTKKISLGSKFQSQSQASNQSLRHNKYLRISLCFRKMAT